MRIYWQIVSVAVVAAAVLAGCGGSDSGLNLRWEAYAPPASAISDEQLTTYTTQQLFAGPSAVMGIPAGDFSLFAYGRIPALQNVLYELAYQALGGLLPMLPLQAEPANKELALLNLLRQAATAAPRMQTAQNAGQPLPFDWTDPDYGIRWTGQVVELNGMLIPRLRGLGPDTDLTLDLTFTFELGSRARLTGAIRGHIVGEVDEINWTNGSVQTMDGRVLANGNLDLAVNVIAGQDPRFTVSSGMAGEFQVPANPGWATAHQNQLQLNVRGLWSQNQGVTLNLNLSDYSGSTIGPGVYWARHSAQGEAHLTAGGDLDAPDLGGDMLMTDNVVYSDGKTGQLVFDFTPSAQTDGGLVTGFLRTPSGATLATIDGTLLGATPIVIHWADGSETVVDWLL